MFKDVAFWHAIRARVLVKGQSKRRVIRDTGLHWETLDKILKNPLPLPYKRMRDGKSRGDEYSRDTIRKLRAGQAAAIYKTAPSPLAKEVEKDILRIQGFRVSKDDAKTQAFAEMFEILQGQSQDISRCMPVGQKLAAPIFLEKLRNGTALERKKALAVVANCCGYSQRAINRFLRMSSAWRYCRKYRDGGVGLLFKPYKKRPRLSDSVEIKEGVLRLLHTPPSAYNINRTSWTLDNLRAVLPKIGLPIVSKDVLREVIKTSGCTCQGSHSIAS